MADDTPTPEFCALPFLGSEVLIRSPELREHAQPYQALAAALLCDLAPEGPLEEILVGKIAADLWRLRRVIGSEREAIVQRLATEEQLGMLEELGVQLDGDALRDAGVSQRPLEVHTQEQKRAGIAAPPDEKLGRYESRLQASVLALLRELRALQERRQKR